MSEEVEPVWDWKDIRHSFSSNWDEDNKEWRYAPNWFLIRTKELGEDPNASSVIYWAKDQIILGLTAQLNEWYEEHYSEDYLRLYRPSRAGDRGPQPDISPPSWCVLCHEGFDLFHSAGMLLILDGRIKAIHTTCIENYVEEE